MSVATIATERRKNSASDNGEDTVVPQTANSPSTAAVHHRPLNVPSVVVNPTTALVHDIFGSLVGNCVAAYPCSYFRQPAQLYATEKKLLVYSNVLGFERRLCLDWNEIDTMELFRTTSIRICTIDAEEHVIRSLDDREWTLQLLQQLKQQEKKRFEHLIGVPLTSSTSSSTRQSQKNERQTPSGLPDPMPSSSRRRASSEPGVGKGDDDAHRNQGSNRKRASLTTPSTANNTSRPHLLSHDRSIGSASQISSEAGISSNDPEHTSINPTQHAWQRIRMNGKDQSYADTPVDGLELNCSVDTFFDLFLDDDAPYSIPMFQKESIRDYDIQVTPWQRRTSDTDGEQETGSITDTEGGEYYYCRTITFCHPLSTNIPLGPSSAMARREQRLRRFSPHGILLEAVTYVQGIPASDCMYVDNRWWIEEALDDDGDRSSSKSTLTVQHQTRFTKSTMLKKVITSSTKSETAAWYDKYTTMLLEVLALEESISLSLKGSGLKQAPVTSSHQEGLLQSINPLRPKRKEAITSSPTTAFDTSTARTQRDPKQLRWITAATVASVLLSFFLSSFLALQVRTLQQEVASIRSEMDAFRQEWNERSRRINNDQGYEALLSSQDLEDKVHLET